MGVPYRALHAITAKEYLPAAIGKRGVERDLVDPVGIQLGDLLCQAGAPLVRSGGGKATALLHHRRGLIPQIPRRLPHLALLPRQAVLEMLEARAQTASCGIQARCQSIHCRRGCRTRRDPPGQLLVDVLAQAIRDGRRDPIQTVVVGPCRRMPRLPLGALGQRDPEAIDFCTDAVGPTRNERLQGSSVRSCTNLRAHGCRFHGILAGSCGNFQAALHLRAEVLLLRVTVCLRTRRCRL
mmetsp:Transcript_84817/g.245243  ORF Transcript_84817/g.245243 Transcript_84817/m.245243 type:complete len:239 (+) Transcript_84817:1922-2638(+)